MNYSQILKEVQEEVNAQQLGGKIATYIPELAKVNPDCFGMHLTCVDGQHFAFGDSKERFSIQSISKVLSMALAMQLEGNDLWKRVDVEPSGTPFNSLIQLENENGIPRNPLINAGAIVVADVLVSHLDNPKKDFLSYVRQLSGHQMIHFDLKVAQSEARTGFRNAALAHFLKSYGNLQNDVDTVLDFYFHQCSIAMSCHELVDTFMVFANGGCLLDQSECFFTLSQTKRINAIMQTCGFYDEAGEFTFRVGLPGKSGVGGGIVAVHPQQYAVAVWSPPLNPKGNSAKGMAALELLTTKTGLSIF